MFMTSNGSRALLSALKKIIDSTVIVKFIGKSTNQIVSRCNEIDNLTVIIYFYFYGS